MLLALCATGVHTDVLLQKVRACSDKRKGQSHGYISNSTSAKQLREGANNHRATEGKCP